MVINLKETRCIQILKIKEVSIKFEGLRLLWLCEGAKICITGKIHKDVNIRGYFTKGMAELYIKGILHLKRFE